MKRVKVKPIVEGDIIGTALVSKKPISFFGGVEGKTGLITDIQNELYGTSVKDKIFVFPESIGSTVGSYVIYSLRVHNVAPLALVTNHAETIVIAGAILSDIPLMEVQDEDIIQLVQSGDKLIINSKKNELIIEKPKI